MAFRRGRGDKDLRSAGIISKRSHLGKKVAQFAFVIYVTLFIIELRPK